MGPTCFWSLWHFQQYLTFDLIFVAQMLQKLKWIKTYVRRLLRIYKVKTVQYAFLGFLTIDANIVLALLAEWILAEWNLNKMFKWIVRQKMVRG